MTKRQRNGGIRKVCGCTRRRWPKCSHPWHFNYRWKAKDYRLSLDRHLERHIDSKSEAEREAEKIRIAIREERFTAVSDVTLTQNSAEALAYAVTLETVGSAFVERFSKAPMPGLRRRGKNGAKASAKNDASMLRVACAFPVNGQPFGSKPITAVTEDDVEAFVQHLRTEGRAVSTVNSYVQLFRMLSRWAVKKGYRPAPLVSGESAIVKRDRHARRNRRVATDEERALLAAAAPHLQRLIIAALETGARLGELLQLQRRDVDLDRRELRIRAATAKDGEDRHIPISARLLAVLQMAVLDVAGRELGPDGHVFSDGTGEALASPKKAWQTAVLRSQGHKPAWVKGKGTLTPESRAAYRAAGLHFHDLRHEAGSRLLEAGWPLHYVRDMLGHEDIATTNTYLNANRTSLQDAMRRTDAARCKPVANEPTIEPPSLRNDERGDDGKSLVN